jgi:hypothetical protein
MKYQHVEFGFLHPSEALNPTKRTFIGSSSVSAIGLLNRVDRVLEQLLARNGKKRLHL